MLGERIRETVRPLAEQSGGAGERVEEWRARVEEVVRGAARASQGAGIA